MHVEVDTSGTLTPVLRPCPGVADDSPRQCKSPDVHASPQEGRMPPRGLWTGRRHCVPSVGGCVDPSGRGTCVLEDTAEATATTGSHG